MKTWLANTNERYVGKHYEYMIKQNKYATHNHNVIGNLQKNDLLLLYLNGTKIIGVGFVEKTFDDITKEFNLAKRIGDKVVEGDGLVEGNGSSVALEQFVLMKWVWTTDLKLPLTAILPEDISSGKNFFLCKDFV